MNYEDCKKQAEKIFPDAIKQATPGLDPVALRAAYLKACKDILTGENLWKIWVAGKVTVDELWGQETTTKFFGERMRENLPNLFEEK